MPYTDDPKNSPADAVRFLVQDKDNTKLQLTDAEIAFLLDEQGGDSIRAAARAAEVLAARFAGTDDYKRVGPLELRRTSTARTKAQDYVLLAKQLWARANMGTAGPWAGGISRSDKASKRANRDRVPPFFGRRMQHYHGTTLSGDHSNSNSSADLLSGPGEDFP